MTALAFLAGVVVGVVGVCGLLAVSLTMFSSRLSRREESDADEMNQALTPYPDVIMFDQRPSWMLAPGERRWWKRLDTRPFDDRRPEERR